MPTYTNLADLHRKAQEAIARQQAEHRARGGTVQQSNYFGQMLVQPPPKPGELPAVPTFQQPKPQQQQTTYSFDSIEDQAFNSMVQTSGPPNPYMQGTQRVYQPNANPNSGLPRDTNGVMYVDLPRDWRQWTKAQRYQFPGEWSSAVLKERASRWPSTAWSQRIPRNNGQNAFREIGSALWRPPDWMKGTQGESWLGAEADTWLDNLVFGGSRGATRGPAGTMQVEITPLPVDPYADLPTEQKLVARLRDSLAGLQPGSFEFWFNYHLYMNMLGPFGQQMLMDGLAMERAAATGR